MSQAKGRSQNLGPKHPGSSWPSPVFLLAPPGMGAGWVRSGHGDSGACLGQGGSRSRRGPSRACSPNLAGGGVSEDPSGPRVSHLRALMLMKPVASIGS